MPGVFVSALKRTCLTNRKWCGHHRTSLRVPTSWTCRRNPSFDRVDHHGMTSSSIVIVTRGSDEQIGRLDHPPNSNKFEAERCQFVPGYNGALLWEAWVNSDFGILYSFLKTIDWLMYMADSAMGVVSRVPSLVARLRLTSLVSHSAKGGMVAFGIIVGDSIPHVFAALFPSLPTTPVLWLLTDRRAVIVIFILGVSFPLSLYRDIAKVSSYMYISLCELRRRIAVSKSIHTGVDQHACNHHNGHHARAHGIGRLERESQGIPAYRRRRSSGYWCHFIWYESLVLRWLVQRGLRSAAFVCREYSSPSPETGAKMELKTTTVSSYMAH